VNEYILAVNGEIKGLETIQEIDRRCVMIIPPFQSKCLQLDHVCRISAVPTYPGLRRFKDSRDFAQWTGDDSKALMKVSMQKCPLP
jgi:hypothetical protein